MPPTQVAILTGNSLTPSVEVPVSGLPSNISSAFRDWVSSLPERLWDAQRRTWVISGFGPDTDPDAAFARFQITPIGPDGEPTQLSPLVKPLALPSPADPGWALVYPRLAGRAAIAGYVGPDAAWQKERRCFLTRGVVFAGRNVDWCQVDPSVMATLTGRGPALVSTESVLRNVDLHAVTAAPESLVPAVQVDLPATPPVPLLSYDGTIDGLRGVPLVDLARVEATTATSMLGLGIGSVYDLIHHVPRDYIDMSNPLPIGQVPVGTVAAIVGTITKTSHDTNRSMTKATVRDAAGDYVSATWFNAPWVNRKLHKGGMVLLHGKMTQYPSRDGFGLSMTNPLVDPITIDEQKGLIGIYPASGKHEVTSWTLHHACTEAAGRIGALADPVPESLLRRHGLPGRGDAYRMIHNPKSRAEGELGRTRIAYDELLRLQLALLVARAAQHAEPAVVHTPTGALTGQMLAALPFTPTGAQTRAVAEITADMASPAAMHRLLQGDVGSGKTAVALLSMLVAQEGGFQAALIAPTEILATQHYDEIVRLLGNVTRADGSPVEAALLTNKVTGKARKKVLDDLASGTAGLVIGTHAVFADKVKFAALGLVIIDEQHRFGSEQRRAMLDKGAPRPDGTHAMPDILYATATPIPRTAMMTVFGDLDVSILDEKPAGRTPTVTVQIEADDGKVEDVNAPVWAHVRSEVAAGRQAFVLCPRRDSQTAEAAGADFTAERLSHTSLSGLRVAVVTGKQPAEERREVMGQFERGEVDVLVATTVIEVGVNVPNATVMVVLDADRFGLAQLHQVRGRVGRGQFPGTCYLVASPKTQAGIDRLAALVASNDGFVLAEKDLEIRGAGQLLGASQSGTTRDLRVANILTDTELLTWAKQDAALIMAEDQRLARRPQLRAEIDAALGEDAAAWLTAA